MIVFPHAKINLGLNVVEKRKDGFHNIETLFYPIQFADVLEFIESPDGHMNFENSGIVVGQSDQNLCIKAYQLLKRRFDLPPLHIHLNKNIPIGAGLGGGSSDGAFMLKSLNSYFNLGLELHELSEMAAALGSDCPFFIYDKPLFAEGKGDTFSPVEVFLKGYYIRVVYPNTFVPTSEAYRDMVPGRPQYRILDAIQQPVDQWKDLLVNDFEQAIFKKFPVINEVKQRLYKMGAVYASMSGSGSAVYGLFVHPPEKKGFDERYIIWDGVL
jgi:4-diphosphocytidyl-2-C-methyl-D-erythritol kinase